MEQFADSESLWQLLFGSTPLDDDVVRWQQQKFVFTQNFVLEQKHGGPCGILATVQAFMLIDLIFESGIAKNFHNLQSLDPVVVQRSLVRALLKILQRAGSKSSVLILRWNEERAKFFTQSSSEDHASMSLLDFLATLVVHRGIETVKADMDDIANPLISRFGHCSQEILNLVLFGRATSNVFDGQENLGEGMSLRGVPEEVDILVGLLSELEALRYVTVGSKLKNPLFPFWILGSTNHYTLLFGFEQVREKEKDPFLTAFEAHASDAGIATEDSAEEIAKDLNLSEEDKMTLKSIVKENVLLLSDYEEWIQSMRGHRDPASPRRTSKRIDLIFIDGQHPVSVLAVTLSEQPIPIPETMVDYGENLRSILATKWPQYKHVCAVKLV